MNFKTDTKTHKLADYSVTITKTTIIQSNSAEVTRYTCKPIPDNEEITDRQYLNEWHKLGLIPNWKTH
jgi:hypothetical protein